MSVGAGFRASAAGSAEIGPSPTPASTGIVVNSNSYYLSDSDTYLTSGASASSVAAWSNGYENVDNYEEGNLSQGVTLCQEPHSGHLS